MIKYEEEEEEVVPNAWSSDLPSDLLGLISEKLRSMPLSAFIKFGSACFEWRSFCIQNYQPIKLPSKLPVLLIPHSSPPIPCTPTPTTTTTVNRKFYYIPSPPSLIEDEEAEEDVEEDDYEDDVEDEEDVEEDDHEDDVEDEEDVEEDDHEEADDNDDHEKEEVEVQDDDDGGGDHEEDDDINTMPPNYYDPRDIWDGQDYKQRFKDTRNLYNISENTVYDDLPFHIPYYKNIRGSSHGWLVTVEEVWTDKGIKQNRVQLFNPFRTDNNTINLPPFPSLSEIRYQRLQNNNSFSNYLHRTCLSANPSSLSDFTELVVLGVSFRSNVSFCRPGDKGWTHLKNMYAKIQDIFCYEGRLFYAILITGYVFAFVIDATQHPKHIYTVGIEPPQQDGLYPFKNYTLRYLVNCNGHLLQIRRDILHMPGAYQTCQFIIFKLDSMDQWEEIKNLNNNMLFLGGSSTSMSLCALDYPGCKPNSIYYTDNYEIYYLDMLLPGPRGPHDIGVYNVEDGSFERYYNMNNVILPSPVWIQPML